MTRRAEWWLLVLAAAAAAGFGLAWLARDMFAGDIALRAMLIGAGKVVGWIAVLLFVISGCRADRAAQMNVALISTYRHRGASRNTIWIEVACRAFRDAYVGRLKRVADVGLALPALIAMLPLMFLTAVAIYCGDRGPILFRQRRIGRDGRGFTIYKFRSMPVGTGELAKAAATSLPITPVGRWIRRFYIDELPQLINIVKGDMSIVGPRPVIASEERLVELRRGSGALRLAPGLTGLAQIQGYNGMPIDEKAQHDATYASTLNLIVDITIMMRTAMHVLKPPHVC